MDEFRKIRINFGTEWGSVHVALGETRCLTKVSCEVTTPKSSRPNEGQMYINVEFGPMAAPHFEPGKAPEIGILTSRILERAFSDSRCVDLESLCIVSEEKVWQLRVDVSVLNDSGNVCDCASLGVLAALHHFRRPDVTSNGDSITIHTERERDAIPLVLHHFPVCVSFAIFESVEFAVADPSALEERVSQSSVVFGINSYQELCGLHLGGSFLTSPELMLRTAASAAKQAKIFVDLIRGAVEKDGQDREAGKRISFMQCILEDAIKTSDQDRVFVKLKKMRKVEKTKEKREKNKADAMDEDEEDNDDDDDAMEVAQDFQMEEKKTEEAVIKLADSSAVLIPSHADKWLPDNSSEEEDDAEQKKSTQQQQPVKRTKKKAKKRNTGGDSSEEEDTMVVTLQD